MNMKRTVMIAALMFAPAALAETLFINDATVHTMSSRAVLQNADVLVRDGLIESVGLELSAPADATVIEAGGRPLTPGLFAGITSLGLVEISMVEHTADAALSDPDMRPEFDVTPAYNPWSSLVPVTRIEGFSWSMLGADRSGSILGGQGQAVILDGSYDAFLGDRILFVDIGADASAQSAGSRAGQWMLLEQAFTEASTGADDSPHSLLTPAGRQALAGYTDDGIVVFNADRASDILQVLAFSNKHGLAPVITGGAEAWMVADQLAEAGVPVLLDALLNLPGNFDRIGARLDNATLLHAAGVTLAFTGAGSHNARKLRQVAGNAVSNGLPWDAALAALTVNPAIIFGLQAGFGKIEPGSRADLVIWSGDPLEVTTAADQVIIGGQAVDMVSRQTLLRDRYLQENPALPRAYIKP